MSADDVDPDELERRAAELHRMGDPVGAAAVMRSAADAWTRKGKAEQAKIAASVAALWGAKPDEAPEPAKAEESPPARRRGAGKGEP